MAAERASLVAVGSAASGGGKPRTLPLPDHDKLWSQVMSNAPWGGGGGGEGFGKLGPMCGAHKEGGWVCSICQRQAMHKAPVKTQHARFASSSSCTRDHVNLAMSKRPFELVCLQYLGQSQCCVDARQWVA